MATQDGKAEGRASEKESREGEGRRAEKETGAKAGQPGGTLPPRESSGRRGGYGKLSGEGVATSCEKEPAEQRFRLIYRTVFCFFSFRVAGNKSPCDSGG